MQVPFSTHRESQLCRANVQLNTNLCVGAQLGWLLEWNYCRFAFSFRLCYIIGCQFTSPFFRTSYSCSWCLISIILSLFWHLKVTWDFWLFPIFLSVSVVVRGWPAILALGLESMATRLRPVSLSPSLDLLWSDSVRTHHRAKRKYNRIFRVRENIVVPFFTRTKFITSTRTNCSMSNDTLGVGTDDSSGRWCFCFGRLCQHSCDHVIAIWVAISIWCCWLLSCNDSTPTANWSDSLQSCSKISIHSNPWWISEGWFKSEQIAYGPLKTTIR